MTVADLIIALDELSGGDHSLRVIIGTSSTIYLDVDAGLDDSGDIVILEVGGAVELKDLV